MLALLVPGVGMGGGEQVTPYYGPLVVEAAYVFTPGAEAAHCYTPGAEAAYVYTPGAERGTAHGFD